MADEQEDATTEANEKEEASSNKSQCGGPRHGEVLVMLRVLDTMVLQAYMHE